MSCLSVTQFLLNNRILAERNKLLNEFFEDLESMKEKVCDLRSSLTKIHQAGSTDEQEMSVDKIKQDMQEYYPDLRKLKDNHTYLVDMSMLLPDNPTASEATHLDSEWNSIVKSLKEIEKRWVPVDACLCVYTPTSCSE